MLVSFHKCFIMEGENTITERKHFWSKPKSVRQKIYTTTNIHGICDDSELDTIVEAQIQKSLTSSGWGKDFSGWQRVLTYEESLEISKRENWSKDYIDLHLPTCKLTIKTLDNWTVAKAAKEQW